VGTPPEKRDEGAKRKDVVNLKEEGGGGLNGSEKDNEILTRRNTSQYLVISVVGGLVGPGPQADGVQGGVLTKKKIIVSLGKEGIGGGPIKAAITSDWGKVGKRKSSRARAEGSHRKKVFFKVIPHPQQKQAKSY